MSNDGTGRIDACGGFGLEASRVGCIYVENAAGREIEALVDELENRHPELKKETAWLRLQVEVARLQGIIEGYELVRRLTHG